MDNRLAKKCTFSSLCMFALPNVIMMMTLSMYIIVDGMFISHLLGTTALSAANMIYPLISMEMAIAIMIATGGSAIIAKKLGEGNPQEARENFSFLILIEVLLGLAFALVGNLCLETILTLLGVSSLQISLCREYAGILLLFAPAFFLQTAFQTFFVTAGKPTLGFIITLAAGILNIVLDYVLMAVFSMGIGGAAVATGLGYCIPAWFGLWFFFNKTSQPLYFVKIKIAGNVLLHACMNGSSEMVSNAANAVTTLLFNFTFLAYYGEDGVAAITIILYFQYIFTALYFGYANGIAPMISYQYGCQDVEQLRKIFKNSMLFLCICTLSVNVLMHAAIQQILMIFTAVDSNVYHLVRYGFSIYSIAFLLMGLGIFASSMFTALLDGKTSAIISFSRTFLFIVGAILLLPMFWQESGVWMAVPLAEACGFGVAVYYIFKKKQYGYLA